MSPPLALRGVGYVVVLAGSLTGSFEAVHASISFDAYSCCAQGPVGRLLHGCRPLLRHPGPGHGDDGDRVVGAGGGGRRGGGAKQARTA